MTTDTWIQPVILSGGSGTRLWPLSRTQRPKQMLTLGQDRNMIAATVARVSGPDFAPPIIVAGAAHEALVDAALDQESIGALILEPAARNTAPAIALAAHKVMMQAPETLLLVMPSDHLIKDTDAFHAAIHAAAPLAADEWLVTFGIQPSHAETGYGYIEAAEPLSERGRRVARFHEKPDAARAEAYVESGEFYWNAGIFLMRADAYLAALETHAEDIARDAATAWANRVTEGDVDRPDRNAFASCASQSIDYAVMEPAARKAVIPVDMGWSDIGGFAALHDVLPKDTHGNAVHGDAIIEDSSGTLLWAEDILVAAVGVDDLAIVATPDAVTVMPLSRAQDIKRVVDRLKADGRPETERHLETRR
ncbi:MAG: mannose-1-phosphate guanylyltransferase/mannose-6-phosphate isomerase [Pseudomonadota bacterium]